MPKGYGMIGGYDPVTKKESHLLAHRLSWEIANGTIPDGKWVLHRCDNPPCVNPAHLFLGDSVENVRDKMEKGRHRSPVGEQCNHKKLTDDAVREILAMYPKSGITQRELAERFGVDQGMISKVVRGHNWKHIQ